MRQKAETGMLTGVLGLIERLGNRLPDPVTIFALLTAIVVVASVIAGRLGASAVHPITQELIAAQNLLAPDLIRRWLIEVPQIFVTFPPLALGLVVMFGAGVAEKTGLLSAALRALVLTVPAPLLTPTLAFAGVMSSLAADAGYVVLIPLGAALFAAAGRHPLAGLAVAFAGVSGGFSANLLITPLDPLLFGITEASAQFIDPEWTANIAGNYYFMLAFTPVIVTVATLVTEGFIAPKLGEWRPSADLPIKVGDSALNREEKRGLRWSGLTALGVCIVVAVMVAPAGGVLRGEGGSFDPFFQSLGT
ncbi:MAG: AbgT family transporter, partial [Pseudomonadota bacterium]